MFRIGVNGDGNAVSILQDMPLSAFAGSWQHYAFVRSGADGNVTDPNRYNKIRIYHNGEMIADANALRPIFGATTPYDGTLGIENFRLTSRPFGFRILVWQDRRLQGLQPCFECRRKSAG